MEKEDPHTSVFSPSKGGLAVGRVVGESVAGSCSSNNSKRRPHKRFLRSEITPESTIPGAFKRVRFLRPPGCAAERSSLWKAFGRR